ncbi:caspase family protein [Lacipirellula limnantheis]|uniref:Translocation protein TolB n=1 Tax=Lacipirellula limnantheis TaxID=2528024 RepID=A0A517TTM8_9BACT|nr:caspase family protein [Lacipirellula limnantheis]QDT71730.1 translocation protein TolB [Lacipirellula limnantheis]
MLISQKGLPVGTLVVGWLALAAWGGARAEGPLALVPEDEAILELDIPDGVRVEIDGQAVDDPRRVVWSGASSDRPIEAQLAATFADGGRKERSLLMWGGHAVRLPLRSPAAAVPTPVLQIGHAEEVSSVAFSPDGKLGLTGSWDNTAAVWDVATGRRLRTLEGHADFVSSVAFSPDGKLALTGSGDNSAAVWDVATGRRLRTFEGHAGIVSSAAFSPDGKLALTGSFDKLAAVWDVATGRRLRILAGHTEAIGSVAFSPDGKLALTGSGDKLAAVWDVATGRQLRTLEGHNGIKNQCVGVYSVAFSPDGKLAITGSADETAVVWDIAMGRRLRTLEGHAHGVNSVAFSPDGKLALTGSFDKTAAVWEVATGRRLHTLEGHAEGVNSVAFSPDGKLAITGSVDDTAAVWDVTTGRMLRTLEGHAESISSVVFSPDGTLALTGSRDEAAAVWEVATGRRLHTLEGHADGVNSVAFSPDGKLALTGSFDETVAVWDVAAGRRLRTLEGHTGFVNSIAFSPDGKLALTGCHDDTAAEDTAALWDVATGRRLRTLKGHAGGVDSVAFSPDGKLAVTGGLGDALAALWDVATGRQLRVLEGHNGGVKSVAFSLDGKLALTGSGDNSAAVWDVATGRRLQILEAHTSSIWSVAFSPDGKLALTGSNDRTAVVWNVASGRRLRTLEGHVGGVSSVAFSPDGKLAVTQTGEGVAAWDVATGDLVYRQTFTDAGILTTTPEGLFDGPFNASEAICYRRVGGGLRVVPVSQYYSDLGRPGLYELILQGERPMPAVDFSDAPEPQVRFVFPETGAVVTESSIQVVVEATDAGSGVEGIRLTNNQRPIPSAAPMTRDGDKFRQTYLFDLAEGNNLLETIATSDGKTQGVARIDSASATVVVKCREKLTPPDLYIVAVGVGEYADAGWRLHYPPADARELAQALERRGRKLFREVHAQVLVDADANSAGIEQAFQRVAQSALPQDCVVATFSGHGHAIDQVYYFLPQEFKQESADTVDQSVRRYGIAHGSIAAWLRPIKAQKVTLAFDTCHSGHAIQLMKAFDRGASFARAIEDLNRSEGVQIIAAAATDNVTQEVEELGHGILSYALLGGLGAVDHGPLSGKHAPYDTKDGSLSVAKWLMFASDQVSELNKAYRQNDEKPRSQIRNDYPIAAFD